MTTNQPSANESKLSLASAIVICINSMIGAGIFATPETLARTVGPAGILTYLFVIGAVLCMALCLARVAHQYPEAGSFYTYAKQWGGHIVGVFASGAYIIGVLIAMGLLAQTAAANLVGLVGLDPGSVHMIGLLIIGAIITLNILGIRVVTVGQYILLACTLFALLTTIALCLSNAQPANLTPFMPEGLTSLAQAIPTAMFAFFGFESAASLFAIIQEPEKNVPKALTASLLIVGLLYLLFIGSIILAIPREAFQGTLPGVTVPLPDALAHVFPHLRCLARIISVAIITAILGVLQAMMFSTSAFAHALFARLHNGLARWFVSLPNSFSYTILLAGLVVVTSFVTIRSPLLFFNFTALFVVTGYLASIITLVAKGHNKTWTESLITAIGILTGVVTLVISAQGVWGELVKY